MATAAAQAGLNGRRAVATGPTMRTDLALAATTSHAADRAAAARRGRSLQHLTIAWNSAECVVALIAGFLAGSIALVGFGFDSAIEVTSSLAALWRLRRDSDEARREAAENERFVSLERAFSSWPRMSRTRRGTR